MVRPLAGKPISIRTMMSPEWGSNVQAERSKISCWQREMDKRPLLPEPFALKVKRSIF